MTKYNLGPINCTNFQLAQAFFLEISTKFPFLARQNSPGIDNHRVHPVQSEITLIEWCQHVKKFHQISL